MSVSEVPLGVGVWFNVLVSVPSIELTVEHDHRQDCHECGGLLQDLRTLDPTEVKITKLILREN